VLDEGPPGSPLPAPTPHKARPPTRPAARRKILDESDDEADPLAIAMLDTPYRARDESEDVAIERELLGIHDERVSHWLKAVS
jgi:hypothetical protein